MIKRLIAFINGTYIGRNPNQFPHYDFVKELYDEVSKRLLLEIEENERLRAKLFEKEVMELNFPVEQE
jgi:hypothetical protein